MEIKAKDMCPRCKHCLGMTHQGMYSCGKANDGSELNIGIDVILNCANFEWKDGKVEGKVSDICSKCKNCKGTTNEYDGNDFVVITGVECEDPYDGMIKTLAADSDVCCSMFEVKEDKLMQYYREKSKNYEQILTDISRFVPVDVTDFKDLPKIIEQMRKAGDMYDSVSESYDALFDQKYELQKANEKLEDKVHKLERRLLEENKRFARLDSEFLIPLAHVLYPGEAKICKPYSEVLDDVKMLNKGAYDLKEDNKRLAEKNKALFEENLDHLDKHTKQCQEIDNLKNELKKANKLADSWKRDYEFVRDQLIHPIYDILYPDIPNRDINVTDFINNVKDLKVYEDENKSMYEDLKYWRERCHGAETDVTTLNSKVEVLEKKLQKADSNRDAVWNESKLNQTISDQEVTIKALLITIKEICKEDETNA